MFANLQLHKTFTKHLLGAVLGVRESYFGNVASIDFIINKLKAPMGNITDT